MPDTVGTAELAEWLDITPRRIQQLVQEEVLPRQSRGQYPLKECVQAYCRWKDELLMKRGTGSEMNEEKLLTARLERRRRELEFAKLEGRLVTVEHHERVMGEAFALVRTNLRNLPGGLAPRLAGLDHPRDVERILVPAIDGALRAIVELGRKFADDALPHDVPGRDALKRAGISKVSELLAVSDVRTIAGIGAKTEARLLEWVATR